MISSGHCKRGGRANNEQQGDRTGTMNHRVTRLIFASAVGLLVAFFAFSWITNPVPRAERQLEESVVAAARERLQDTLALAAIEVVDPLAPDRKVGKSYVYRAQQGWEVSGYYRRGEGDRWHPFLMSLDATHAITHLKVRDAAFVERARDDVMLEALP